MMRKRAVIVVLFVLLPLLMGFTIYSRAEGSDGNVSVLLTLYLREYGTNRPIGNVSISIAISTILGHVERIWTTDENGRVTAQLGEVTKVTTPTPPRLTKISLPDDYALIKVNNVFIEDTSFTARYVRGKTEYANMQITVDQKSYGDKILIEVYCWALKGKVIKISSSDPLTGEPSVISVKPAARVMLDTGSIRDGYESYYFVPLGYEVLVSFVPTARSKYTYPPLRVIVDENVSFINWMRYAADSYSSSELSLLEKEISWLSSMGLSLTREIEEYGALRSIRERALSLYEDGAYDVAINGMSMFITRLNDMKRWLSNLRVLAVLGAILISVFIYGMASLSSNFIFEEVERGKARLAAKILIFTSLTIMFSLTNPSSKIACAMIIEMAVNASVKANDLLAILVGALVISASTYFFMMLASIRRAPVIDLALQMGVRGLKRRPFRTMLTLFTIVVVVSSSIFFVNISIERETKVRSSWPSTKISGLIIDSTSVSPPVKLSIYDVEWIRRNNWCMNISYMEAIKREEYVEGAGQLYRAGVIYIGLSEQPQAVNIVCIDPDFMERQYELSKYIIGFWNQFSKGEKVALLPKNYGVTIGDYIRLGVSEVLITLSGPQDLGIRSLGLFRVVGKFDPLQLMDFKRIDNSTLFADITTTVLLPIGAIEDPAIGISEITVMVAPGFNPIDAARDVAYSLGLPVIANKDSLASLISWSLEISLTGFLPYLVPLVIAGLMIYATVVSVYEERKRELFTLATLGLDPRNTFLTFIIETLLLGFFGTFIGFVGSYIVAMIIFSSAPISPIAYKAPYMGWSIFTVFVALFTGVFMVFLGGYIPSMKAQGLSLMGRVKRRELVGEIISENGNLIFMLPIREVVQNSELLYNYVRETLNKMPSSQVDRHSIKGEIRGDGSFSVSFVIFGYGQKVSIPCEIRGERSGDIITPLISFPKSYGEYEEMRRILRDLEAQLIGFSAWRDMQLKMRIVREAPKKEKTIEETIDEIRGLIEQIKDSIKKIRILDAQRSKLTEEVYEEFRQKYLSILNEKFKSLRTMTVGLEPYTSQIQEEIKKTRLEIERITISYNLGEISEEEYIKICSPLQNKLDMLENRLKEIEEIFEFLKKPTGII
ncbi:FtsX-like permease family protein [Candidatus Bathyarchaeota archaeon]|nr:FtsX-like permease family protein [Candidatus Bathyarchaeota archaeon]